MSVYIKDMWTVAKLYLLSKTDFLFFIFPQKETSSQSGFVLCETFHFSLLFMFFPRTSCFLFVSHLMYINKLSRYQEDICL